MILFCPNCADRPGRATAYQNEQYGYGNRVHNQGLKAYTCTVCGTANTPKGKVKAKKGDDKKAKGKKAKK